MRIRTMIAVAAVLSLSTLTMAADNPFVGTWKLNLAKTKYTSGQPSKSETWKIEAQDNGQKDTFDGVDANGKPYHVQASPKYDGKDYPITGSDESDTVALKRIDANTIDAVLKKGGKEVSRDRVVISKDGKAMTSTNKGKDAKGQDYTNIAVYEKQ